MCMFNKHSNKVTGGDTGDAPAPRALAGLARGDCIIYIYIYIYMM